MFLYVQLVYARAHRLPANEGLASGGGGTVYANIAHTLVVPSAKDWYIALEICIDLSFSLLAAFASFYRTPTALTRLFYRITWTPRGSTDTMSTLFVVHGLHGNIAAYYGSVDGLESVVREMGMDYTLYFMMKRTQNIDVCFQIRNTAALVRNVFGTLTDFFVIQNTK